MPDQSSAEDAFKAWEAEQQELNQARIDNPDPNDLIERRAELRDSGMDEDQIDSVIQREYPSREETPERSEWYRQSQEEHKLDLAAPQRFPLTGDGLVTQRVIADGPGPDIGAELALARYRDHQYAEKIIPARDDEKLQSWLHALLNKAPEQKRDAQLLLSETRNQEIEEQTRKRSLSL